MRGLVRGYVGVVSMKIKEEAIRTWFELARTKDKRKRKSARLWNLVSNRSLKLVLHHIYCLPCNSYSS